MIIRARVVVTMDGPPIENGAVAVSGDHIVDIGKFPEVSARHSGEEVVDLGEQLLLPGLINAHCHLDYTCLRGKIPRPKSFTHWIRAINAVKAKLGPEDYVASINEGLTEARRFGTTTIANLTAFPELNSKIEEPIRTWWFAELIDVRSPERANKMVDLAVESLRSKEHWGLAPHAPFTASENLYQRSEEAARRENVLLTTHLAESREEMSMFRDANGPLYELMKEIGRLLDDCGHHTPVEHFFEILRDSSTSVGMTDRWMLVHLNELMDDDFELLARSTKNFQIVHCPRSHEYFGHSPFQFGKLRDLGFNICLGTDSLASNEDLNLFAEMRAFQKEFPEVRPEKIFEMVTVNSARALGKPPVLGKIRETYFADLIAIPCARQGDRTRSTSMFEEIVNFGGSVSWSMIDGAVREMA